MPSLAWIDDAARELSALGEDRPRPRYPVDHEPAMQVPKGGSSCASCEYLGKDGKSCTNKYFIKWHGSGELPFPADEFCSDWYEPRELKATGTSEGAVKGWDSRGRGRKSEDKYLINPDKRLFETGKPINLIGYHNSGAPNELKMGRRGIFFAEAPATDYGEFIHRAQIRMQNPLVAEEQVDAVNKLWPEESQRPADVQDMLTTSDMEKFGTPEWWGTIDRAVAAEAQKRGHDSLIYTDPEALSLREFGVFDKANFDAKFIGKVGDWVKKYPEEARNTSWVKYIKQQKDSNSMDLESAIDGLLSYGTSEGVIKEWDTRGRGSHEDEKFVLGVREATEADLNSLAEWKSIAEAQKGAPRQLLNRAKKAATVASWIQDDLSERSKEDSDKGFVVDSKEHGVVGAMHIIDGGSVDDNKNVLIASLATRPDVIVGSTPERGVGTKLMLQAAKYAASLGKGVTLGALPGAVGYYQKLGMHQVGTKSLPQFAWTAEEAKAMAQGVVH